MGLFKLIELFNNVNGESNRAGIVGNGTGNALANPPVGVGREFIALVWIKFFRWPGSAPGHLLELSRGRGLLYLNSV